MGSLEDYSWPRKWIKKELRFDGRVRMEGSGRTFFNEKELPVGFLRVTYKNSKVSL
jgi:hypothetical protein